MSKTKKKKTDRAVIRQQMINLQNLLNQVRLINIVGNYIESEKAIGVNTEHFRFGKYIEQFNAFEEGELYAIQLIDDSMIAMHYIFDDNERLLGHTLSYLPDYKKDLFDKTETTREDASIEVGTLARRLSRYIRVDYSEIGKKEYIHTDVHLHIGLYRDSLRIPLKTYLLPNDFLYLVFKYIYHTDEDELKCVVTSATKMTKLSKEELSRFFMCYGIDTFI